MLLPTMSSLMNLLWFLVKRKNAEMWLRGKASFSDIRSSVCNFFILHVPYCICTPTAGMKNSRSFRTLPIQKRILHALRSQDTWYKLLSSLAAICAILFKISSEMYHAFICVLCSYLVSYLSFLISLYALIWFELHFSCLGCFIISLFYVSQNMLLLSIKYVKWIWRS
jgi:hypothetical protein